ncbi:MAG: Cro/Cl family transcriptional regulator [Betaproteobacteria bacterium]|nr:Cro/Cl family transcriptional regulator [Betaproteobacteria bacterium]
MSPPVTTAPPKPAVPPGASLAYNHAAVHAPPGAFGTCALLRPALRASVLQGTPPPPGAPPATPSSHVRPEPADAPKEVPLGDAPKEVPLGDAPKQALRAGHVTYPCAAPCVSTSPARTEQGSEAVCQAYTRRTAIAAADTDEAWDHTAPASTSAPDLATASPTGPAALRCAIAHCGGQSALASAIGLSQSHVWNWLNRRSIPAEHCPAIERATNRAVRCEALRPDVDWAYLRAVCEELAGVREEA